MFKIRMIKIQMGKTNGKMKGNMDMMGMKGMIIMVRVWVRGNTLKVEEVIKVIKGINKARVNMTIGNMRVKVILNLKVN